MEVLQEKQFSKSLSFRAEEADSGSVTGCPSVMGVLDWDCDVILPGAFKTALPNFIQAGTILNDHQRKIDCIVGYPTVAEERGNVLYSEFKFHSDDHSQDVRTKMRERIEAGKDVGLSIGFATSPDNYQYHRSGKDLLDYVKAQGYDLSLFDTKAIQSHRGTCQTISKIDFLMEYSLTPVPANSQALVSSVKAIQDEIPVEEPVKGGDEITTETEDIGAGEASAKAREWKWLKFKQSVLEAL